MSTAYLEKKFAAEIPSHISSEEIAGRKGLTNITRRNTRKGVHPYDEVEWELRTAAITNEKGEVIFEQRNVEVPKSWSMTAANIVTSKYFRGTLGTPERESSVKQLIARVACTIANWGLVQRYFETEEAAEIFEAELTYLLVHQHVSFNSPVWFNCGVEKRPQCSACFINSVKDSMSSILDLAKTEGMLFKGGSGTGTNLSSIRSSHEGLQGGGSASGPVSFMKGFDAFAGVIKSGGKTRRAAKMVILNMDHPDVEEFIDCKAHEEQKAWALIDSGYDGSFNGEAYNSVFFQNSNNSVRATDEFMWAVLEDKEWRTRKVTTGKTAGTYKARELMKKIGQAAWICGDPGMQFDTTINSWHTCSNTARINASNPCVTGETLVSTPKGYRRIESLVGSELNIIAGDGQSRPVSQIFPTGRKPVYQLKTRSGYSLKLTADHRVLTANRGDIPACELTQDDFLVLGTVGFGDEALPTDLAEVIGLAVGDGCVNQQGYLMINMDPQREQAILEKAQSVMNRMKPNRFGSVTKAGSTSRVSTCSPEIVEVAQEYALLDKGSSGKCFTDRIFSLNKPSQAAILRGLFTTDGTVANYGEKSQYVALDSTSLELLRQAQLLLLGFGIKSKIYENRRAGVLTSLLPDGKGGVKEYSVQEMHSLRISRSSRRVFQHEIGFMPESQKCESLARLNQQVSVYQDVWVDRVASVQFLGEENVYDLTEPRTSHFVGNGLITHNCSEYMFLDDTACNLASLNLMKFRAPGDEFDSEAFIHAVTTTITAMEIIVDNASYPTKGIEHNSYDYRPLGLGYANLGALLMSRGLPYDSDEGRDFAAAVTALMHGQAYKQSAIIAEHVRPFKGYEANREPMLNVIQKHRSYLSKINPHRVPPSLPAKCHEVWNDAYTRGIDYGYRNSQVTVLAPTGTIGFMMDCDTTGVEPDIALVKYKKLVGGGLIKIVNNTVPLGLKKLGYSEGEIQEIAKYIDANDTIEGAPALKEEHLPVFDCAFKPMKGKRSIHYMAHIKMMSAVQPFLSGAISKTVNLPHEATVEDIIQAYIESWKLGIKSVAVYRDGCKRTQPLNTSLTEEKKEKTVATETRPVRRKLPDERKSITHKFSIAGHEGYLTVGMYEDGTLGEVFIVMAKEGSVVSGLVDSFATSISLALQYGVPLKALVDKFTNVRFEPSGITSNPEIRFAKSIMDYLFRWLTLKFLSTAEAPAENSSMLSNGNGNSQAREYGNSQAAPAAQLSATDSGNPKDPFSSFQAQLDAPPCPECGEMMVRSASCYKCLNCGATSGCS
ncbi:MAG: intein-containing adenosylcobalamin-dependent ribonucleoside-diphosphate reductase [Candidatus Omnitrophica bacterium]|nr:intein-containing adenosylcobalamin-dependent ribonucleoside-diphosphate reductase [Candidatus Omnitrophota bacterium]